METELDAAWESAIHNAERARKAEAEIERLIDLLRLSRDVIYYGAFPIGWNIDRLDEEIRSRREALATPSEESK